MKPSNFVPFPNNPLIAKFFIQLGRVEELGSGILTTSRLTKEYADEGKAVFIEGGTFKTIIPRLDGKVIAIGDTVNDTVNDTVSATVKKQLVQVVRQLSSNPEMRISQLVQNSMYLK